MALLRNGVSLTMNPGGFYGTDLPSVAGFNANFRVERSWHGRAQLRNLWMGQGTYGLAQRAGGYPATAEGSDSWSMPNKAGGLAARTEVFGSSVMTASNIEPIKLLAADILASGDLTSFASLITSFSAELSGSGDLAGDLRLASGLAANLAGSGDISASLGLIVAIEAALSGTGGATGSNLTGFASIAANILSYGELTPEGIRDSVWNAVAASYNAAGSMGEKVNDAGSASNPWTEVVESGYTAAEILRLIAAATAGKLLGATGTSIAIRSLDDTKTRIAATVDADGNRTAVSYDAAP